MVGNGSPIANCVGEVQSGDAYDTRIDAGVVHDIDTGRLLFTEQLSRPHNDAEGHLGFDTHVTLYLAPDNPRIDSAELERDQAARRMPFFVCLH